MFLVRMTTAGCVSPWCKGLNCENTRGMNSFYDKISALIFAEANDVGVGSYQGFDFINL